MTTTNYVDPWSSSAGEPLTGSSAPNSCWRYVTAAEMEKLMGSAQHLKTTETLSEYRNRTREAKHALAVKKAAERAATARAGTARAGTARAAAKQAERIKQIEENNAQWLKTQKGGTGSDFVDQLFDAPNLIAGAVVAGICWGFIAVMSTPGGSAVVVWLVGFGLVASFLNDYGKNRY